MDASKNIMMMTAQVLAAQPPRGSGEGNPESRRLRAILRAEWWKSVTAMSR